MGEQKREVEHVSTDYTRFSYINHIKLQISESVKYHRLTIQRSKYSSSKLQQNYSNNSTFLPSSHRLTKIIISKLSFSLYSKHRKISLSSEILTEIFPKYLLYPAKTCFQISSEYTNLARLFIVALSLRYTRNNFRLTTGRWISNESPPLDYPVIGNQESCARQGGKLRRNVRHGLLGSFERGPSSLVHIWRTGYVITGNVSGFLSGVSGGRRKWIGEPGNDPIPSRRANCSL